MRMIFAGVLAGAFVASLTASPALAANECQSVRPLAKRVACVEQKADKNTAAIAALTKQVGDLANAVTALNAKVDKLPKGGLTWDDLKGVKVEWTAHPSVCLYFKNWDSNGNDQETARSVIGCNNEYYMFTIRK